MEIHHPPDIHHTKRWKDYLIESIMLFLAVFCGFLAENAREFRDDHQRELQYLKSLAEDLKRDTSKLNTYVRVNNRIMGYCDSLQHYISHENVFKNSNHFYDYCRELARYVRYYPTDRTMDQLKNAGNMRLIRNWDVSNAITEYDARTKSMSETDLQLREENIKYRGYLIEFLDLSSYDKLNPGNSFMDEVGNTKGNPGFIVNDEKMVKIIYNEAFTFRILIKGSAGNAQSVIMEANNLLALLYKDYGIG